MMETAHPELSRDYFEREARKGRRVIFLWHVSKRWPPGPDRPGDHWEAMPDEYIEGIEFSSAHAAQHFEIEMHMTGGEMFATWEEAEEWLQAGDWLGPEGEER